MRIVLVFVCLAAIGAAGLALYKSGTLQFNDPNPEEFKLLGIDVSHHQGEIDWEAVATSGVSFAYIKSTEGGDFVDPRFAANWSASAQAGVPRGAYHFFTFCTPGRAQAENFVRVARPTSKALHPVADVEFVGNCKGFTDLKVVRDELAVFLSLVEEAWGRTPILYLTPDSLERVIGSELTGYPVWIRSVFTEPAPDAFRRWLLWQFSDNARLPGIDGPVDRNALRPGESLAALGWPAA
ncbi:MAG: GH25 family lysozyme [Myxococcota bacterium]